MIKFIPNCPEDLIAISVNGDLGKEDFEKINGEAGRLKEKYGYVNFYVELIDFKWPSAGALWEDFKLVKYLNDIEKYALVTAKEWIEKIARAENHIFPGELKVFEPGQQEEAKHWASRIS